MKWIHRPCGAQFDTLAEHDAHAADCEPWEPTEQIYLPDGSSYTTERPPRIDTAKHILENLRAAKQTVQRIMEYERLYHGEPRD